MSNEEKIRDLSERYLLDDEPYQFMVQLHDEIERLNIELEQANSVADACSIASKMLKAENKRLEIKLDNTQRDFEDYKRSREECLDYAMKKIERLEVLIEKAIQGLHANGLHAVAGLIEIEYKEEREE